jgi:hypothetical protein
MQATQEAEIGRITVQGQLQAKSFQDPVSTKRDIEVHACQPKIARRLTPGRSWLQASVDKKVH